MNSIVVLSSELVQSLREALQVKEWAVADPLLRRLEEDIKRLPQWQEAPDGERLLLTEGVRPEVRRRVVRVTDTGSFMATIGLEVVRDGETAIATIVVETRGGESDSWKRSQVEIISTELGASRKIMLGPNARLFVEGMSNTELVYDKEQNATIARKRPPVEVTVTEEDSGL